RAPRPRFRSESARRGRGDSRRGAFRSRSHPRTRPRRARRGRTEGIAFVQYVPSAELSEGGRGGAGGVGNGRMPAQEHRESRLRHSPRSVHSFARSELRSTSSVTLSAGTKLGPYDPPSLVHTSYGETCRQVRFGALM